jgi:hypothetical protein
MTRSYADRAFDAIRTGADVAGSGCLQDVEVLRALMDAFVVGENKQQSNKKQGNKQFGTKRPGDDIAAR